MKHCVTVAAATQGTEATATQSNETLLTQSNETVATHSTEVATTQSTDVTESRDKMFTATQDIVAAVAANMSANVRLASTIVSESKVNNVDLPQPITTLTSCQQPGVSRSFSLLSVPVLRPKKQTMTIRKKIPKALSGSEALKMLMDRENAKKAEEEAKERRKIEREIKRKQKAEEKEKKRIEREENKRKRELEKLIKAPEKASKRARQDSSSSSGNDERVQFAESDSDFDEKLCCPGCGSDEGSADEWVQCSSCPRKWHITCTGDAVLYEIPFEQLANYPFRCELCL